MRLSIPVYVAVAAVLLVAGTAFADKQDEVSSQRDKPWSILTLPEFANTRADVNETEPGNNTCPGEPYALLDTYHAALTPNDNDWISFSCNQGDLITIGTDADGALPTVDTYIRLFADDCATQYTFDDDGGPGLFSLISNFPAPYTGSYNVQVHAFSPTQTGNYILIASCSPPPNPLCPVDTYKAFKYDQVVPILDFPAPPFIYGPIVIPDDGTTTVDVVVDLGIEHTWIGDLIITLTHIPPGLPPQTVDLINRPPCSGDLIGNPNNKYYLGTGNLAVLGVDTCPPQIPVQCYGIPGDGLVLFRDKPKAGEWFLTVSDNAGADVGYMYNFSLHFLNHEPVSVEALSWGSIKADYR